MIKYGFIGCGNIGKAMIEGLSNQELIENTYIYDHNFKVSEAPFKFCENEIALVKAVDIVFLAIKPNLIKDLCLKIKDFCKDKIIVSLAAGDTVECLESFFQPKQAIARLMPNTLCRAKMGTCMLICNDSVKSADKLAIKFFCEEFSSVMELEEKHMDAFIALAGSSPAYFYMMIEAMGDAGVKAGLKRDMAYHLAASAMQGSAALYLQSQEHPAKLKDAVCSPSGTTIEAVLKLEELGFKNAISQAVDKCVLKSKELSHK